MALIDIMELYSPRMEYHASASAPVARQAMGSEDLQRQVDGLGGRATDGNPRRWIQMGTARGRPAAANQRIVGFGQISRRSDRVDLEATR